MTNTIRLNKLPRIWRVTFTLFVCALVFGFSSGYRFLYLQSKCTAKGISQQYAGVQPNSFDEGRSEKEVLAVIHSHLLAMSPILLILSALILLTGLPCILKKILVIEPFISLILTFGGIWLIWAGFSWMSLIVSISGIAMAVSLYAQAFCILFSLWNPGIKA